MTKEEYEKLLKSDYWKGFSYSLIKERNFTCEDCGRTFYNERNKLQVHHLVYRDIKPWSYKPEELIVLCEDCHKKRHGIETNEPLDYSGFMVDKDTMTISSSDINKDYNSFSNQNGEKRRNYIKYAALCVLSFLVIWGVRNIQIPRNSSTIEQEQISREVPFANSDNIVSSPNSSSITSPEIIVPQKDIEIPNTEDYSIIEQGRDILSTENEEKGLSPVELVEKRHHEDVVKQAKSAGVSTEGSTVEILQRIHHEDVVKQAKRAGVSTEGSTVEILQRMHHEDVVKQAKRAGVSTEGSTVEILQRIHHADVVKQARRAGVSTEGSTVEILQRIQQKEMERYNY